MGTQDYNKMWNNQSRAGSWQSAQSWGGNQSQYGVSQYDNQSWQNKSNWGSQYDLKSKTSKQSSVAPIEHNNNNNDGAKRGRGRPAGSVMSNAAKKSVINSTFDKKLSVVSVSKTSNKDSRKLSSVSLGSTAIAPKNAKGKAGRPRVFPTKMAKSERRRAPWPGLDPTAGPGAPPLTIGFHPGNSGRGKLWRGQPTESIEAEYEAKRQWRMERQRKWLAQDKIDNPDKVVMKRDPNKKYPYTPKQRTSWPGVQPGSDPPVTKGFQADARGRHLKFRDVPPEILANEEEQRLEHKRRKQRVWCAKQRAKPGYVSPNKTGRPKGRPRLPDNLRSMRKVKKAILNRKSSTTNRESALVLKSQSRLQSKQSGRKDSKLSAKQSGKQSKQSVRQSARAGSSMPSNKNSRAGSSMPSKSLKNSFRATGMY